MTSIFEKNINAIKKRFPHIYIELERAESDDSYIRMEEAKNGDYLVPILFNGKAMHSKYSHIKESEKMFSGKEETTFFCGIGAGFHIRYFLNNFPRKQAMLTDFSYSSFKRLLELCDISDIISHESITLLPPIQDASFTSYFVQTYIPILMGNLSIIVLRVWRDFFYKNEASNSTSNTSLSIAHSCTTNKASCVSLLDEKINFALNEVAQDVSTQARFGRIWMRNILLNLKEMSELSMKLPKVDTKKTAYILGAGPSLEDKIEEMKEKRDKIVIFASDASFLPLLKNGITPDFFVSIDPQITCSTHCIKTFPSNIIAIFDLAASHSLARQFVNNGNEVIFSISRHPFSQYISSFSALPQLDVGGGTVAIAALNVAYSLGFTDFESAGLDFAYTNGKSYARGVYLHDLYQKDVNRLMPEETCFTSLMFRSRVEKVKEKKNITYRTELLDSYKRAFQKEFETKVSGEKTLWTSSNFSPFLYEKFIEKLVSEAKTLYERNSAIFLPFITWQKMSKRSDILGIKEEFIEAFFQLFC